MVKSIGLAIAGVTATCAAPAFAQTPAPGQAVTNPLPPTAQAPIEQASLQTSTPEMAQTSAANDGDIIVTAQKRSERLQNVPIAVNVVGATQLADSGIKELQQLNSIVPGLNIATTLGAFQPTTRGVGTSSNVVENPTALYIDGIYLPQQREGLRDLADIEQVTVLKGPQGTLFGRNATAGVIQITTRAPSFTTQGAFTAGIDNYATVRGSAYITGGITDTLAASGTVSISEQGDGYGRSLTGGFDTYRTFHNGSARLKLLFQPDAKTKFTLIADYLDRRDAGSNYQPYPGTTFAYAGFGPVSSRYDTYAGTPSFNGFYGGGVSLEMTHDFTFGKLVSISSYRRGRGSFQFDFDNVAATYSLNRSVSPNEDYTEEVQIVSPGGARFNYVAGVFYIHSTSGYDFFNRIIAGPLVAPPANVTNLTTASSETAESVAPFAQVDIELFSRTKLTLGARYTYETRALTGSTAVILANGFMSTTPSAPPELTFKRPTFRVALDHQFATDILGYVSYNRGFKSGGFNIAVPANAGYQPETLDDYEVGFKTQFLDRRLTFNANAFYYDYTNVQVATFVGTTQTVTNGAKAKLYGIDIDFRAKLADDLTLSGGAEALHSEFTDYPNAVLSSPRPTGGVVLLAGSADGRRLPLAQNFVGTLALDYGARVGRVNTHFNVTGTYNSDYYFEADNFLRQPAYVMLNASIRFSNAGDKLSLTLAASNLLDESIIARNVTQPFGYLINYGYAPRLFSATVGLKF